MTDWEISQNFLKQIFFIYILNIFFFTILSTPSILVCVTNTFVPLSFTFFMTCSFAHIFFSETKKPAARKRMS